MTNYRMKRLQNIEENKERIMVNTRRKITEPKKKTVNWTFISTSMAVIVLCSFGAGLLWDSIETSHVSNQSSMVIEQSEVEKIVIDIEETGESITVENRETIGVLADWLNEVSSQPQSKLKNEQSVLYQINIINTGDDPSGAISITNEKLIMGDNFNEISEQQYEQFSSLLFKIMDDERDVVYNDLFEIKVEANYDIANPDSHSGWKTSPEGLQQATIVGKGKDAAEEGEALLVIENLETNESTIYKLKDNSTAQNTPKYVEWIDENRLFVIVGLAHGTVTMGGQLYEMNIEDNTILPVFEDVTGKEEIMSIKANGDGAFTYQKHIYLDDDLTEGRIEEGTLPFPPAK